MPVGAAQQRALGAVLDGIDQLQIGVQVVGQKLRTTLRRREVPILVAFQPLARPCALVATIAGRPIDLGPHQPQQARPPPSQWIPSAGTSIEMTMQAAQHVMPNSP